MSHPPLPARPAPAGSAPPAAAAYPPERALRACHPAFLRSLIGCRGLLRRRDLRRERRVKPLTALLRARRAADDEHGVLVAAGIVVEAVHGLAHLEEHVTHREVVTVAALKRRQIAAVKERGKCEFRLFRQRLAIDRRDRLAVSKERPDADHKQQRKRCAQ